MSNWDKNLFIDHLREQCSREVAKVGVAIIEFTEEFADDVSWGRGTEHGDFNFSLQHRYWSTSSFPFDI